MKPLTVLFQIKNSLVSIVLTLMNTGKEHRIYFISQFMGRAGASDLMQSLTEALKDLDYANKMVQVFIDGPNVN